MQSATFRRLQDDKYKYVGAEDGYRVAAWFNINKNRQDSVEVLKLLRDLQMLMSVWPKLTLVSRPEGFYDFDIEMLFSPTHITKSRRAKMRELISAIRARFERLFAPPTFFGFTYDQGRMRTVFQRDSRRAFPYARIIATPFESLGRDGLLDRIRQCLTCGKWIYARFQRERFCSGPCREKAFRSSPEGKEKRKKYMQGYRERLEQMEQNFLKAGAKARR